MRTPLLLLALVFSLLSYSQEQFDFRLTNWGMSKEQVKKTETATFIGDENNLLSYKGTLAGYECTIEYFFTNNILARTRYIIMESRTNTKNYVTDYNSFKELLTKKYGQPKKDKKIGNSEYEMDLGYAILNGNLTYYSNWENENTLIFLGFFNVSNSNVAIGIEYSSKKYKELEEKNTLKDF
jgi:hypothetical protein